MALDLERQPGCLTQRCCHVVEDRNRGIENLGAAQTELDGIGFEQRVEVGNNID
jgi:hypothetical protein